MREDERELIVAEPMTDGRQQLAAFATGLGAASLDDLLVYPKFFELETTSLCNANPPCVMCYIADLKREQGIMTDDLFEHIAADLAPHAAWINKVTIQLLGEPLIDRQLEPRIARLKQMGIRSVAFSSNAVMMHPARAESILASGVDEVSFSVDGATAETFHRIRPGLRFDKVVDHIEQFVATRDRLGAACRVRIRMVIQAGNAAEYEDFLAFWAERLGPGDTVYGKLIHREDGRDLQPEVPAIPDLGDLNSRPCTAPWSTMVILADGRVCLCLVDTNSYVTLGNVREQTIQEMWQSDQMNAIRERHLSQGRRGVPMCLDCNPWDPTAKIKGVTIGPDGQRL